MTVIDITSRMIMTEQQLQILKTELANPPYAGLGDEDAANVLNEPTKLVDQTFIDAGALMACIVPAEFGALKAAEQGYLTALCRPTSLPATDTLQAALTNLFPAASVSRANILAMLKRAGSRAEELGLGRVNPSAVAKARKL